MSNTKILNKKEVKEILKKIEKQWGSKLEQDYAWLQNNQSRVFVVNNEASKIDLSKLKINSIGMYFCDLERGLRLSVEGSQLVGPKANKNILEVSDEQSKMWMSGEDIETDQEFDGFVLIKHNDDYLGTGKYSNKKIFNYIGKERRINAIV